MASVLVIVAGAVLGIGAGIGCVQTFGDEMNVVKFFVSSCYGIYSIVLFWSAIAVSEIAHDQLPGIDVPLLAQCLQLFEPIGPLFLVYPVMIVWIHWRFSRKKSLSVSILLGHFLGLGFTLVVFSALVVASLHLTYLNGAHPVTGVRIFGNVAIGIGCAAAIVVSYRRNTEQADAGKPDPAVS